MVSLALFHDAIIQALDTRLDPDQRAAVDAPPGACLYIVAGPGSGKTTVLVLRVLRLVFVDSIPAEAVVATTFTRRAARELRSRILGWGDRLRGFLLATGLPAHIHQQVSGLDLNAIVTGTLDSIAESVLAENRAPATAPPVVIEDFVAQALMLRQGLFPGERYRDPNLRDYLRRLRGTGYGLDPAEMTEILTQLRERFLHDAVDVNSYRSERRSCPLCRSHPHAGIGVLCASIDDYQATLANRGAVDFAGLERAFADALGSGRLEPFAGRVCALLVDEYQDTNLLQEEIYTHLAQRALASGGGITVVGDDDQSLYRFRGATVDLFQDFPRRLAARLGVTPQTIFLGSNYRSTPAIVEFCKGFVRLDPGYQVVRVRGKPPIAYARKADHNPTVLAMFRPDATILAQDLAHFVHAVFCGKGYTVPGVGTIQGSAGGSVGDCALLCYSPREIRSGTPRLPKFLREELHRLGISVFNPRGQDLAQVPEVQQLCGLMLECIDPQGAVQRSTNLPGEASDTFNEWRAQARRYVAQNPPPQNPNSLRDFVAAWQQRRSQVRSRWPDEANLVDLAYKLVTWIPAMQNDIEGLVHLEVILRTIVQASQFSRYGPHLVFGSREHASVRAILWDILTPLATGAVKVDEDLLETLPRDRLNILSIHQAKGLEFPMAIVDVGSDFQANHWTHAFKRFPRDGDVTHRMEDELRQFSPLGVPGRSPRDRAFDDLVRLYFVAFSRAQDVLLLVGLSGVIGGRGIQNIATGWDRIGRWHWGPGLRNLVHI